MLRTDPITTKPFLSTERAFVYQACVGTRAAGSLEWRPVSTADDDFLYRVYASCRTEEMKLLVREESKTGFSANAVCRAAGTVSVVLSESPP